MAYPTVFVEAWLAAKSRCLHGCIRGVYCTGGGKLGPGGGLGSVRSPRVMSAATAAAFRSYGSPQIFSKISKR